MSSSPRSGEIDILRVIAIILMTVYHAAYDLAFFYGWNIPVNEGAWKLLEQGTAALFLLLVGISFTISWTRTPRYSKYVLRGARIFCYGLVVTAATYVFDAETYVRFGILHLVGVSMLLLPLFTRLKNWNALLGIAVVLLAYAVHGTTDGTALLLPLGKMPPGFMSVDYFPLVPWFGVILIGVALGHLYKENQATLTFIPTDNPFMRGITAISRRSLAIYMIHQPVLLAVLWLLLGKS